MVFLHHLDPLPRAPIIGRMSIRLQQLQSCRNKTLSFERLWLNKGETSITSSSFVYTVYLALIRLPKANFKCTSQSFALHIGCVRSTIDHFSLPAVDRSETLGR